VSYRYHGVIFNSRGPRAFQTCVVKHWGKHSEGEAKGSRYLGILQKLLTVFPLPEPLAQMIAPPPVLPEEPVAVTRTLGFVAAKASNGCATR
jgi:hypothetical protein